MQLSTRARGANTDVSRGDVIDALKFTVTGNFEARKGARQPRGCPVPRSVRRQSW
jgi:hypothetical protein